ncbi:MULTISPECIES: hypothetical protein [Kocuria]|uniref:Uncharacterized protein n=1 Tax=Kocuria rhizophila TaxID=72000 RepID=A0AAX2SAQ8_KOCRH|nr:MULTISPECIES: hypothetical protein [Kocuria]WIW67454.1 hypothetical protein P8S73_07060 [Kocuria sp. ChxB]MDR7373480.1 hypothetical protein [Kocuria rhizophila]OFK05913.1 hypothetical protein HMPREF2833_07410 [Kocuria sp. HMSC066H03]PKZ38089.1 hypothetical protein CYJ75_02700 [Kocuria rhizophila]RLP60886.1 hypothetical protein D9R02_02055 [Kocuria rhizophila]
MEITGEYFLFGTESAATRETREAVEDLGFERITSGVGYAVGPGEIADAVTVAYFTIQSVSAGDVFGAALQVLDLLRQWARGEGRPQDVRRCDVTFKNGQTGDEVFIDGFEYKTTDELVDLLKALRS